MAYNAKVLYAGQLPNAKGDLYTVGGATTAFIHNIILHNINTVSETVELLFNNGTEYQIIKVAIAANETVYPMSLTNEGLVLEATDKISGLTSVASKVTCIITGTEET